jgi:PAS domain S-box-containing protein
MEDRSKTRAELIAELESLRAEVMALRAAQRVAHVGNWQWDRRTNTTIWSEETYRIHGLEPEAPLPEWNEENPYLHPDDRAIYQSLLERAAQGFSFEVDLRIVRLDGEIRYIEARGEPGIFDQSGELIGLFGTVLDVTDRKRVEEKLRRSEFALREAQKVAHVGSWQWDSETNQVVWSEEIYRIHGIDPSIPPPTAQDDDYVHPDDREIHRSIVAASLAGQPYEVDLRIIRPDGEIRHVEARGALGIRNEQGELIGLFGTVLDVTDRKLVEEKLRRSEANLARAQKIAHIGSWEYDIATDVTTWSEELYRIHQLNPDQPAPTAEEVVQLIHPDDRWIDREGIKAPLLAGKFCEAALRIIRQDGESRHIEVRGEPLFGPDGEMTGFAGTVTDITERYELERLKTEFISVVSHELRTPLTSMQVALSLLNGGLVDPSSENGRNMLHRANEGVDRLVRLVNDILDLERLESGRIRLQKQPCWPLALIETAIEQVQGLADCSDIDFKVTAIDLPIYADGDRLVQVLTNLLGNAIRYSPAGLEIEIGAALASDRDLLLFSVRDCGRGIPADRLDTVFDRFARVDGSDAREKSGTGLGLAICKGIIQQHRGQIWVESFLGRGSTFYFTVPISRSDRSGFGGDDISPDRV